MLCTFTESYKCLGLKSRISIYQFKDKEILNSYKRRINVKKYLYMADIKGITLAKHFKNSLTVTNYIALIDYDLNLYVNLAK